VAVIGGGQSGAEILLHLLNQTDNAPSHLAWISQRPNFLPLDETPFTNELFTPPYVASFRDLPEPRRHATVEREKLAGDGVSSETLTAIYRRLYVLRHLEPSGPEVELLPHRDVVNAEPREGGYQLIMRNGMDGMMEIGHAEIVILATGYRYELPDCLAALTGRIVIDRTGRPVPDADFAIAWDGPSANRIFALNAGLISHGIAEPQLSLMAWRGAVIANALLGRRQFDVEVPNSMVNWRSQMHTDARLDTVRSNGRLFSP
jgi:lysine N6-hydroxylase